MKNLALLWAALFAFSAQTPAAQTAAPHAVRQLVYEFGYNTKVAKSGNGTGTTTITIYAPAADGSVEITGQDFWWNTVRPRAINSCKLSPSGSVSCSAMPYAISPIQLTIFPLLARGFFKGVTTAGSTKNNNYKVAAAILPGNSSYAGQLVTWDCAYALHGKGPIANAAPMVLVQTTGTLTQEGGRYFKMNSKQRIAYDPVAKIPVIVSDTRTHYPQHNVYNNDDIELKLTKDSAQH